MSTDPLVLTHAAANMANEGIPVAAIARVLMVPYEEASDMLHAELVKGHIVELPRSDWPPNIRRDARTPTISLKSSDTDIEFACRKFFKLTNLEAGFMGRLLRLDHADKEKLHHVIETQRLQRASRPDSMEMTDQKMVDVMICKLRKKLKEIDPEFLIVTIWGGGYYIDATVKEKIYARLAAEGNRSTGTAISAPDIHKGHSGSNGVGGRCIVNWIA